jgi:TonB-linked SusC/RagA family outer membrane protein
MEFLKHRAGVLVKNYLTKCFLIMKLTIIFILISCLQVSANGYSQTVTLNLRSVELRKALTTIEKTTSYRFLYSERKVANNEKVSLSVKNAGISEVMSQLLSGSGLSYKKLGNNLIVITLANETLQDLIVRGKITDKASGLPLVGVSITVKGSTAGTSTDVNGNYSLNVPNNSTLIISSVGYDGLEVPVSGRTEINISLQASVSGLNEVVVVGYGTKQLSQLSSSVSVVSGKELNNVTSNDITSLLQGKAPGVIVSNGSAGDPSGTPTIIIRGSSSISAASSPLYVVDGIIGGTANPNDVESVTILKDAAATGLYGSRAANGVIIITTKTGKAGKTKINLNSSLGFNKVNFGKFEVMNSQQLYDYFKTFYPPDVFATEVPSSVLSTNTNWKDLAYRTGITQDYTLTVSGGSEKTKVYLSGNYYNEQGTMRTTGNEVYNLRTNLAHDLSSKIKLMVRMDGSFRKFTHDASGHYGSFHGAIQNIPFDNPFNPDGSIKMGTEIGWFGREHDNFLQGWQYNFDNTKRASLSGDIDLVYKINSNLTFSTYNRAGYNNSKNILYYDIRSKYGAGTNGLLNNNFYNNSNLITSNRLEYKNSFGKHNFDGIAVVEAEKNYSDNNAINAQGLPAGLAVIDVASTVANAGGNSSENAFSKGLVQIDYNYDNRYFAVGSFINEASSRFGADNRSANFYTLAASWILTNEAFMSHQSLFDLLKVRLSYGSTGNAQIGNYQSLGLYRYSLQYAGFSASFPSQMANDKLTWEKAKSTNLGFDIGILKRISVNVDLYDKTTNALLLNVPIPNTSGYSSVIRNIGSVQNRGLEINITSDNLKGAFHWSTNFNIAFNRNKVLKLYEGGKDIITDKQNVSLGHDLFSWYMRKWAGVDPQNGDPLWEKVTKGADGKEVIEKTNVYKNATLQFVGSGSPNFTGGFSNDFSYKSFSLNVFFNFVSGNLLYNQGNEGFNSDGAYVSYNNRVLAKGHVRWEKPGDIATEPKAVFGGNLSSNKPSSRWLEDGSYIRLRNIKLSYQISPDVLGKIGVSRASLFVSGDNLWTGTRFTGTDPEVSLIPGGGSMASSTYPISKKVLFGLNVEF